MSLKSKAILIAILTIIIGAISSIMCSSEVQGYYATANGLTWYYNVVNEEAVNVYVYSGTVGTTLTIPDSLGGYPVTEIEGSNTEGDWEFTYGRNIVRKTYDTTVEKIVIPSTVRTIGRNSFAYFYHLEEVEVQGNGTLKAVGSYAFYNCSGMTKFDAPNCSLSIGPNAFNNCRKLEEFNYKEFTSLGGFAFYVLFNGNLEIEIRLSENITQIGGYAFAYQAFGKYMWESGGKQITKIVLEAGR